MKCPHCGKEILSTTGKWIEQCRQLLPLLQKVGEFTPNEAQAIAKANDIATNQFEAYRIWEKLKRTGWLTGSQPMTRWKTWQVKDGGINNA